MNEQPWDVVIALCFGDAAQRDKVRSVLQGFLDGAREEGRRACAAELHAVTKERDELLAWAAEQACEYSEKADPATEPCVEDDPSYRCWPCAAWIKIYAEESDADD